MKELLTYYFWFSQPSIILSLADKILGLIFAISFAVALVFFAVEKISTHPIYKKLLRKFAYLSLTCGISGLIWFGMRFENTPIFSARYWAALVILIAAVWKLFIWKYILFNFRTEKSEYDREQVKNKYIR